MARSPHPGRSVDTTPQPGPTVFVPTVSVIVSSHDREELLPTALRSIQLQDLVDFECIVVDDASTDASAAVAQTFADVDKRFRVAVHEESRGSSAARNTGVALATGTYVCFLDDDDFLLAGSLSARLHALEGARADIAGSYCDWVNTDPQVGLEAFAESRTPKSRPTITFSRLRGGVPFILTSPLVRRSVFGLVGGFREDMDLAEDAEFWFRVCRRGFKFVDAGHVGVAYRRSPRSKVIGDPARQLEAMNAVFNQADTAGEPDAVGPLPIEEPLCALAGIADRAQQVYRYLALIALTDIDKAVSIGTQLVPAAVRAEINPTMLERQLANHAIARLSIDRPEQRFDAHAAMHRLVASLIPACDPSWQERRAPIDDILPIVRTDLLGPTPSIVQPGSIHVDDAILLIPEALYHLDELGPLYRELRRRGQPVHFMMSPKTVPAARSAIARYADTVLDYDIATAEHAAAIVVLNDWGPVKELIEFANGHGIPTYAKVEGVQDFNDDDTGRQRGAYRTASTILGQGANDVAALPEKRVEIVGSTRLERIWNAPAVTPSDFVLINLNFTFNVLTDQRASWVRSVKSAIRKSGLPAGISAHPAERTRNIGLPFVDKSFRHEITRSGVLVSRFSTVPFEAMARGVPFVYHNPHGERVPTFKSPRGGFPITTTDEELSTALLDLTSDPVARSTFAPFFLDQVDVDTRRSSEERTADLILNDLSR